MIINDNTNEVLRELEAAKERALTMIGMEAERNAKIEINNSPKRIDTGLLRNSITWALGGKAPNIQTYTADNPKEGRPSSGSYSGTADSKKDTVFIGSNVEYAQYVHFGTTRMTPNPFLKNAIEKNMDKFKRIVEDELKQ